jgi:RND family efflux transporter MFP subunit
MGACFMVKYRDMNLKETFQTAKTKARMIAKRIPRWGWIVGAIVVIIILLIAVKKPSDDSASTAIASVRTVTDSVVLSGRTQSGSAVDLGFADQGRVQSVNVAEGQKAYQGQILASLDTSDLAADLRDAQASLTIARAGATNNATSLDKVTREQDALVRNAYRALLSEGLEAIPDDTDTDVTAPSVFGTYTGNEGVYNLEFYPSSASSGYSFRVSGLENATGSVAIGTSVPLGTKGLFLQFPAGERYGTSSWTIEIPNKRATAYTSNYSAYQSALATRERVIADAEGDLSTSGVEASIAQAKVQQAQARVDAIRSQISKRQIIAPFSGTVAQVNVKPGETTASASVSTESKSTITMISEADYEVLLKAPEIDVAKLFVGQKANITLDAYGDVVFSGTIVSINPAETILDGVPIYETKVAFDTKDSRIRSGMTASATIVANEKTDVLAIPANFIHTENDETFVHVMIDDDKTEKRIVTTGLRGSDSYVEITSGLKADEKVRVDALK